jgi:hypothetical protein
MATQRVETPVRVGVYSRVSQADRAVSGLLAAGFGQEEISVICSNKVREQLFADFQNPPLPKEHLPEATATGASLGALVLGGLTTLAGIATTGGLALAAVGPILLAAAGGGVAGGLIGAMMTRGITREMANYYDQAVTQGKILVAVEDHSSAAPQRLEKAEEALQNAGAEPVPLAAG